MKKSSAQLQFNELIPESHESNKIRINNKNMKTAWKEAEEKYRQIVDNSLDGLYIVQNFKIKFCNLKLAEIFGYNNQGELIDFPMKKLVAPTNWETVEQQISLMVSGEQDVTHYEFRGLKKDGTEIDIETLGSKITYQGKPAIQGTFRDITQRKLTEEAFQKSEKRYRILFESASDAIYILNAEGLILDVNLAGCLLHGLGRQEIIDKNILEFIHEEYSELAREDLPAVLNGEITLYETSLRTHENIKTPVEIRSRKVHYSGEVSLLFYVRDISDQVKVGESFLESQRALSNFMSNLPGMAYRCLNDENCTMKFVSNRSINLTGYAPDDFINNKKIAFAKIIHPDFKEYIAGEKENSLKNKLPYRLEYKIITAGGDEKWVWEQGRGVFSESDDLLALEGIITDISQLKETEIALRESEKRFRSLIENVPNIAVQGYDINHNIFFWNKASEKFFGYNQSEAIGNKLEPLIYPKYSQEKIAREIDNWIKNGKEIPTGERSLLHKDGSTFEAHSSHVMLKNKPEKPEFYCLNIDVTELNKAKKNLQKSLYKLKRALEGTIRALMSAVEMRDPYTAGHQNGVAKLACAIAKELDFSDDQIEGLRVACLLHDIGNLNIPAEILNKPGRLSDLEYTLLKTHPQFGFEILRTISFPWPVAQMVLQHHEKLDGSGYPQGLSGDQIIREARIITVADVVEPISSHRPYRPALGIEKALDVIEEGKGTLFDPEIVNVCVKLFTEKGFKFDPVKGH